MIIITLGGISMPRTELPATTPTENRLPYLRRFISGMDTRVNTDADAIDEPVTDANSALAATVPMPSPPRIRRKASFATS